MNISRQISLNSTKRFLKAILVVKNEIDEQLHKYIKDSNYDEIAVLTDLAKKFKEIDFGYVDINNISQKTENKPVFKHDVILTLDDEWTNHSPQGFRLNDKNEKIFNNWKDVFTSVLRELFRRDYNLFEQMVSEGAIKGRKDPVFASKALNNEYKQIPNTGYFYKSYGLGPEQMRSYLGRVFVYFDIDSSAFEVFANKKEEKKEAPLKDVDSSKENVVYITDNSKYCPICSKKLEQVSKRKQYLLYTSANKQGKFDTKTTYTKECDNCKKEFITRDTYLTLRKQIGNFDNRINFVIRELEK